MSSVTRWEPMRDMMTLREAMGRLFDDSFIRPFGAADGMATLPPLDMYQTAEEVVVKAALPGVRAEDVDISVANDVLTLHGEFKQEEERKDATYHVREQRYGSFERAIMLPTMVKTDQAKAAFENGILTITLPKAEIVKPKAITIQAK
jgi:HSP20 family protein